jgi:nucleoside recognition membrane protein YjiH
MWLLYNKYIRLFLIFAVIFIFIFYQMLREENEFVLEKQNINSSIKNLVIISATYYEHSKMYISFFDILILKHDFLPMLN